MIATPLLDPRRGAQLFVFLAIAPHLALATRLTNRYAARPSGRRFWVIANASRVAPWRSAAARAVVGISRPSHARGTADCLPRAGTSWLITRWCQLAEVRLLPSQATWHIGQRKNAKRDGAPAASDPYKTVCRPEHWVFATRCGTSRMLPNVGPQALTQRNEEERGPKWLLQRQRAPLARNPARPRPLGASTPPSGSDRTGPNLMEAKMQSRRLN